MSSSVECAECHTGILGRRGVSYAIKCKSCQNCIHLSCFNNGKGITQAEYLTAMKNGTDFGYFCPVCRQPTNSSNRGRGRARSTTAEVQSVASARGRARGRGRGRENAPSSSVDVDPRPGRPSSETIDCVRGRGYTEATNEPIPGTSSVQPIRGRGRGRDYNDNPRPGTSAGEAVGRGRGTGRGRYLNGATDAPRPGTSTRRDVITRPDYLDLNVNLDALAIRDFQSQNNDVPFQGGTSDTSGITSLRDTPQPVSSTPQEDVSDGVSMHNVSAPSVTSNDSVRPPIRRRRRVIFESSMSTSHSSNRSSNSSRTPTYEFVAGGTKRSTDALVTRGYKFSARQKRDKYGRRVWRCTSRPPGNECPAVVLEDRGQYTLKHQHTCAFKPGVDVRAKMYAKAKAAGRDKKFRSANKIAEKVMRATRQENKTSVRHFPRPDTLSRAINRDRAKIRPPHPISLSFRLRFAAIPRNFFRGDVKLPHQRHLTCRGEIFRDDRHLIFATRTQLKLLKKARRLYCDGTYKVVKRPFKQLYSIHAFIKKKGAIKQVPLVFVVMSSQTQEDYKKVFRFVADLVGGTRSMRVKEFVTDFEIAAIRAIQDVFPNANISGCAFHWTQAVYKKMGSYGLIPNYKSNGSRLSYFLRLLLHLHLVPSASIGFCFNMIKGRTFRFLKVNNFEKFLTYMEKTWINSSKFPTKLWSVYGLPIRTNNDCEGWHHRLNNNQEKSNGMLNFYELVELLHEEAEAVDLQVDLLNQEKLIRRMNSDSSYVQNKLFLLWEQYEQGKLSNAFELLEKATKIYPNKAREPSDDEDEDEEEEQM